MPAFVSTDTVVRSYRSTVKRLLLHPFDFHFLSLPVQAAVKLQKHCKNRRDRLLEPATGASEVT